MAEVLATVAIIVILGSLVVMNVVSFQANLRQKELDAKAEIIYTAAQEQMTRIMASGRESVFAAPNISNISNVSDTGGFSGTADGSTNTDRTKTGVSYLPSTNALPGDYDPDDDTSASMVSKWQLCYITSNDLHVDGSAASLLFGNGGLEEELRTGSWVIEYDYKSLTVYSVYYSEGTAYKCADAYASDFSPNYNLLMRGHSYRLNSEKYLGDGHFVGYHGGGGSISSKSFTLEVPKIEINNAEKLTATVRLSKPLVSEDLAFLVALEDDSGNTWQANFVMAADAGSISTSSSSIPTYTYSSLSNTPISGLEGATYTKEGLLYTLRITLDSLESNDTRFTKLFGSQSGNSVKLREGSNLKMKVTVSCPGNSLVDPGVSGGVSGTVVFSSLFGDNSTATQAEIACGRHLQNLDASSGVTDITGALQSTDIDFSSKLADDELFEGWLSTYGGGYFNGLSSGKPLFKPIENNGITKLGDDGSSAVQRTILKLNINTDGDLSSESVSAGLFGSHSGDLTISNTSLVGASVRGTASGSTGGLVGTHGGGTLNIKSCQVYLDPATDTPGKGVQDEWMTGLVTGGLVGSSSSGTLNIEQSSASTVAEPAAATATGSIAGGLVGSVAGTSTLNITKSYADSYLTAEHVGGFVGKGNATKVEDCYSAGYLQGGSTAAGLVNGTAAIKRAYTLCVTFGSTTVTTYYRISQGGSSDSVYYLATGVQAGSVDAGRATGSFSDSTSASGSSSVRSDLLAKMGGEGATWTLTQASESSAYDLDGVSRGSYTWPTIKDSYHYGDWAASFQEGSLVYYEKYAGASRDYGFKGANVSSSTLLDDATVAGDGYGLVYDSTLTSSVTVTVTNPSSSVTVSQTIDGTTATPYTVSVDGKTYYIYPLSKTLGSDAIVNTSQVNTSGYYLKATIEGGNSYYFNPHFALTVADVGSSTTPSAPPKSRPIYIRTARQLYNLSLYYSSYHGITQGYTFQQGRDIAYTEYAWTDFAGTAKAIKSQQPIGANETISGVDHPAAFKAIYDGTCHKITDVSFKSQNGNYVGMFGYVDASATIKNVVLCTDYDPDSSSNYFVQRAGAVQENDVVSMGVLAGYNAGTIVNCAAAGYYLAGSDGTIHAYENSTANIGGLVGINAGSISDSSADSPKLRLSLYESITYAGGFVGTNAPEGSIKNCYALGAIDVADAKGGRASIGGFAGLNQGAVADSYCATAIASSGDGTKSYGFAPAGGRVTGCTYLHGGTYSYINRMYSYLFETSTSYTAGSPVRYEDLKRDAAKGPVDHNHSFVHSQTHLSDENGHYPYRGVVTDAVGAYVHYGNWQDDVVMGTLGIFYWEHEEKGSNNGYHMTYLGSYEEEEKGTWKAVTQGGTTLCTSHDDGGIITEYGYGVYVLRGQQQNVTVDLSHLTCSGDFSGTLDNITKVSTYNYDASVDLQEQMKNMGTDSSDASIRSFVFYAFNTGTEANGSNYLYLNSGTGASAVQNGGLSLTFKNVSNEYVRYSFSLSPFFANAMSIDGIKKAGSLTSLDTNAATNVAMSNNLYVKASDNNKTDYRMTPGTATENSQGQITNSNRYEVRSLQQLQYINWNDSAKNTSTLTNGSNLSQFPYLLYANKLGTNGVSNIGNIVDGNVQYRANRYWLQTHDLERDKKDTSLFNPVAGTSVSSTQTGGYSSYLCAWFGSYYDGQSYTVRNVKVSSDSFHVGLFGTTVGAKLKNIIMRGDGTDDSLIERANKTGGTGTGAYSLGGLVGVAYDYDLKNPETIENCAISGYKVKDSSTNILGLGEVNVGGLVGVCNTKMSRCESTADIVLNSAHAAAAKWGVFIRVGGIAGACQAEIADSYSGGSCTITDATKACRPYCSSTSRYDYEIYIGGIAGSGFTSNFKNFTNDESIKDGSPTVTNCYTYFTFPDTSFTTDYSGYIERELHMFTIASVSDRADQSGNKATISNCYYINTIPTTFNNNNGRTTASDVYPRNDYTNKTSGKPTSRSYEEMGAQSFVAALNGTRTTDKPWLAVTTTDFATPPVPINGKFSYPTSPALEGKNYPFPTVILQNDLTFGSVDSPMMAHVHYGDWPISGTYWEKGRDTMDIFTDMDKTDGTGVAYHDFKLYVDNTVTSKPNPDYFTSTSSGVAKVFSVGDLVTENGKKYYPVKVMALNEGTTNIALKNYPDAVFALQVTANWKVSAYGDGISFDESTNILKVALNTSKYVSEWVGFKAEAADVNGKDYTSATSWGSPAPVASVHNVVEEPISVTNNIMTVTRVAAGTIVLTVTASYKYQGHLFTKQLFINVVEPGVVGLTNGSVFNETAVGSGGNGENNTTYTDATKPQFTPSDTANLRLYATAGEKILDSPDCISKIQINGTDYSDGGYDASKPFYVKFDSSTGADPLYTYRTGKVSYNYDYWTAQGKTPVATDTFRVTVVLKDGSTLTVPLAGNMIKRTDEVTFTFNAGSGGNGGPKQVHWLKNNTFTFGAPSAYGITPDGNRSFRGWSLGTTTYAAGREISATDDMTFTALWSGKLTLVAGSKWSKEYTPGDSDSTLAISQDDLDTLNNRGGDWVLEGWYTAEVDNKRTKILNADGSIYATAEAQNYAGYTSVGKFKVEGTRELYAKWTRVIPKTVYKLATSFDGTGSYVIANGNSGSSISIAFLNGSSIDKYTDATYSVSAAGIIDGAVPGEAIWTTSYDTYQVGSEWYYPTYSGYKFINSRNTNAQIKVSGNTLSVEPPSSTSNPALFTVDPDAKLNYDQGYRNVPVRFKNSTTGVLQTNSSIGSNSTNAFIFEKTTQNTNEETFDWVINTLSLMNGTKTLMRANVVSPVDSLQNQGYEEPSNSEWELMGWYARKMDDAEPVLNADGTAVEGLASFGEDTVLYAKWRKLPEQGLFRLFSLWHNDEDLEEIISWDEH